jgi:hypothetical protein
VPRFKQVIRHGGCFASALALCGAALLSEPYSRSAYGRKARLTVSFNPVFNLFWSNAPILKAQGYGNAFRERDPVGRPVGSAK